MAEFKHPQPLSNGKQVTLVAASGIVGYGFQRLLTEHRVPEWLDLLHYPIIAALVLSASLLLWQKFRRTPLSPVFFTVFFITFGWVFGVKWAVRVSS